MEITIIIMTIFIWIVVGLWINHKREWYRGYNFEGFEDERRFHCVMNVIFSPISLIIAFLKEFLINPWNND
jgi:hypothetical protein